MAFAVGNIGFGLSSRMYSFMLYFYKIQKDWEDDLLVTKETSSTGPGTGRNIHGFS